MVDLLKRELEVGDEVAYCEVGYSFLKVGVVHKLTPKGATITLGSSQLNRRSFQMIKIYHEVDQNG